MFIEPSYKIALIFQDNDYRISISDIWMYLKAKESYFMQRKMKTDDAKELAKISGLTVKRAERIQASDKNLNYLYLDFMRMYPLAKKYEVIHNTLNAMKECKEFTQTNFEIYQATERIDTIIFGKILSECKNNYAELMSDLMTNGEFNHENSIKAVYRYMVKNNYELSIKEEENDYGSNEY